MTSKVDHFTTIAREVFQILFNCRSVNDYSEMETKLQHLLNTLTSQPVEDLAMYLRSCAMVKDKLPTWQPLLQRALEWGRTQGFDVEDAYYGLLAYS
jgi:hypothetical protein